MGYASMLTPNLESMTSREFMDKTLACIGRRKQVILIMTWNAGLKDATR